jgi:hypothetical protein
MPYFIYRVRPPLGQLEALGQYPTFPEASREAKALRAADPAQPQRRVRVIFADNALQAEDLLLQVRERPPGGDDD